MPGTYGYDNLWIEEGSRVEISPATDLWMRGDRYGTVVSVPRSALEAMDERHARIRVRMDKTGRVVTGSGDTFRAV